MGAKGVKMTGMQFEVRSSGHSCPDPTVESPRKRQGLAQWCREALLYYICITPIDLNRDVGGRCRGRGQNLDQVDIDSHMEGRRSWQFGGLGGKTGLRKVLQDKGELSVSGVYGEEDTFHDK